MKNDIEPANKGETGFDADDLNLISLAQEYSDEDKARELLERLRWPNGAICPHCKNDGKTKPNSKLTPKAGSKSAVRKGVYFCGACRKQFTVTVKTVFEGSHWHHVSREHLPKYANEFAFRWSHSKMTDGARMAIGIPMVEGKRLMYRKPAN
jgi:transposase-like protein